ncbi:addiction module protein [Moheibacter stercoris]|uniref:Addiction module component, TIGR02574 family n=1 Tax=Moheibacter stercoris TaxID=1628251 RepID=A0ABV2LRB3_9FLAO
MDSANDLRNRIRNYIENSDERILKIINALIDSETEEQDVSQSHKELLDLRLKLHKENPSEGKFWEEIKAALETQYGL